MFAVSFPKLDQAANDRFFALVAWSHIRTIRAPHLRRTAPVALTRNGAIKKVATCALCGDWVSWSGKWREPKGVIAFYRQHNVECLDRAIAQAIAHGIGLVQVHG